MNVFRTLALAMVCTTLAAVTTYTILRPKVKQPSHKAFTFPNVVPLDQWRPTTASDLEASASHPNNLLFKDLLFEDISSADILSTTTFSGDIAAHQQYRYQKASQPSADQHLANQHLTNQYLAIDIRYLVNTNGNLKGLITEAVNPPAMWLQQNSTQTGYSLIAHKDYAYLNTCQNSHGATTLSTDQFNRNRLIYDLRPSRILPWLQGKDTLPDQRCLWTQIAVPLANYESEAEAYKAIEAAWADWANWWQPHFPPT